MRCGYRAIPEQYIRKSRRSCIGGGADVYDPALRLDLIHPFVEIQLDDGFDGSADGQIRHPGTEPEADELQASAPVIDHGQLEVLALVADLARGSDASAAQEEPGARI